MQVARLARIHSNQDASSNASFGRLLQIAQSPRSLHGADSSRRMELFAPQGRRASTPYMCRLATPVPSVESLHSRRTVRSPLGRAVHLRAGRLGKQLEAASPESSARVDFGELRPRSSLHRQRNPRSNWGRAPGRFGGFPADHPHSLDCHCSCIHPNQGV